MDISLFSKLIIPAIIVFVCIYGLIKKCDIWNAFLDGAVSGTKILYQILPPLVALLTAVYMLRASGSLDALTCILSPVTSFLGIPIECVTLGLLRPFSGSAALALGTDVIQSAGADSEVGRIAAVMLGSAETTFYTIAVYFGALKLNKTRHALPAALIADLAGYVGSVIAVKLLF